MSRADRRRAAKDDAWQWEPMKRAYSLLRPVMRGGKQVMVEVSLDHTTADQVWGNALYTCHVRFSQPVFDHEAGQIAKGEPMMWGDHRIVHLSVHRRDRQPVRDWRHMQQIKNDILGPEIEAVELYPAESRVVDTANEFHLWALADGDRFPIGWETGLRADDGELTVLGAKQRAFEPAREGDSNGS